MKNYSMMVLFLFALSGCALLHSKKVSQELPQQKIAISGNIVSQQKLNQGGKLAFTDLKAGPLAIADEQTDKVSLKIIQGVTDVLISKQSGISITNDPHEAALVFEGYIEEFSMPGKMSKILMMKHHGRISVSGELYERKTGLRVLSFAASKEFDTRQEDHVRVALQIGAQIGDFIAKHVKESP